MMTLKALRGSLIGMVLSVALLQQAIAAEGMTTQSTLLDRIQIEDMMIEYYWAFASEEGHDVKKYWAEDSEFVVEGQVLKGLEAIQGMYEPPENTEEAYPKFAMLLGTPMIRINGDTATMDAIYTGVVSTASDKLPVVTEQGRDYIEFVKIEGQWKIKKRVLEGYAYVSRESLMEM